MIEFGDYSVGIAQIDDEIKKIEIFEFAHFLLSAYLLVSRSDMLNMRRFSIGGMKKQHDAILESFGTTEEIIY